MKFTFPYLVILALLVSCNEAKVEEKPLIEDGLPSDLVFQAKPKEAAEFAWETFLAINEKTGDGTRTKWEDYKEGYDIFLPNGEEPTAWGKPTSNIPACATEGTTTKILRTTSKVSPIINETDQAVGGVLIDKNSNLVHYEVYMNKPMFEYVVDEENKFYNALNQAGREINFPDGSMELKASWRILDPETDDFSRYHTAEALIYMPKKDSIKIFNDKTIPQSVKDKINTCTKQIVGLVGLHIVYKTPSNPNFVWMTFEHNDNLETKQTKKEGITPSFFDQSKITDDTHLNCRQWDCPDQEMTQVTRQNPIPKWVKKANKKYQKKLRKEKLVWSNYELIGVQWARDSSSREGDPLLPNLANSTMETFNQTASSCVGCHAFARSSNPTILSDFSWVMSRAQVPGNPSLPQAGDNPKKTGQDVLNYVMYASPYKKWTSWKDETWNPFSRAFEGENPHGKTVRIYVNDLALDAYAENPSMDELPEGSIVLKENFHTPPDMPTHSGDLVELTIMYKAKRTAKSKKAEWFWVKSPPYGPVEIASFDNKACISCHMNWKGNGDGLLTFNFGERPVITKIPY